MIRVRNQHLFWSGLLFLALGTAGSILSLNYQMGTATDMGPGYFPFAVSTLLAVLGAASSLIALKGEVQSTIGKWPLVPLCFVSAGVIAFSIVVDRLGLLIAVVILVLACGYQRWRHRPIEILLMAATLGAISIGIFIYGLRLSFVAF